MCNCGRSLFLLGEFKWERKVYRVWANAAFKGWGLPPDWTLGAELTLVRRTIFTTIQQKRRVYIVCGHTVGRPNNLMHTAYLTSSEAELSAVSPWSRTPWIVTPCPRHCSVRLTSWCLAFRHWWEEGRTRTCLLCSARRAAVIASSSGFYPALIRQRTNTMRAVQCSVARSDTPR